MTVRKRLFLSNLLMILVPVVATALIGVLCVSLIWFSLLHGSGFGADDQEDFAYASMAVSETVERTIERNGDLSSLEGILDGDGMALKVLEGDRVFFSYGKKRRVTESLWRRRRRLGKEAPLHVMDAAYIFILRLSMKITILYAFSEEALSDRTITILKQP